MNKSIFSKIIMALLFIAIPSQGLWAAEMVAPEIAQAAEMQPVAPTEKGRIKQMQDAMKSFQKSTTSFLNCIANGKCETEKQEKLAAEITYWSKRVLFLLAIMGASWFVKVQAVQAAQALKEGAVGAVKAAKKEVGQVIVQGPLGFEAKFGSDADKELSREAQDKLREQRQKDLADIQKAAASAKAKEVEERKKTVKAAQDAFKLEKELLEQMGKDLERQQYELSKKSGAFITREMDVDAQARALKTKEAALKAKQQELDALEERLHGQAAYYGVETQQPSFLQRLLGGVASQQNN